MVATRTALSLADYVVTEAGFGADLGAEKFLDIKCRQAGLWPKAVVLVATVRALKHHGGCPKDQLGQENLEALRRGAGNLTAHIRNLRGVWGLPVVVALNHFVSDTEAELALLRELCAAEGAACALSDGWAKGGAGMTELAELVCRTVDESCSEPRFAYPDEASLKDKITAVATRVYHAGSVAFSPAAEKQLKELADAGWDRIPVCIAKTQYSFSDDPKVIGAPEGFPLAIRSVRLSAGAGFAVAFAGDIIAMPGLPRRPAAEGIDVDEDGRIQGLF